jgi:hypothetical protein
MRLELFDIERIRQGIDDIFPDTCSISLEKKSDKARRRHFTNPVTEHTIEHGETYRIVATTRDKIAGFFDDDHEMTIGKVFIQKGYSGDKDDHEQAVLESVRIRIPCGMEEYTDGEFSGMSVKATCVCDYGIELTEKYNQRWRRIIWKNNPEVAKILPAENLLRKSLARAVTEKYIRD